MKKVCPPLPREVLRLRCLPQSRRKELPRSAGCFFSLLLTVLLYTSLTLLEGLRRKLHFFSHKLQSPGSDTKPKSGEERLLSVRQ